MTLKQILLGFRPDTLDTNTTCPKCECRFQPRLIAASQATRMAVCFYCRLQTQRQLNGLQNASPEEIERENASLYRSALCHFGTLFAAFGSINIPYQFNEVPDWKPRVNVFLGKVPDTLIAQCAGVSVNEVRDFRNKSGIRPFNCRK